MPPKCLWTLCSTLFSFCQSVVPYLVALLVWQIEPPEEWFLLSKEWLAIPGPPSWRFKYWYLELVCPQPAKIMHHIPFTTAARFHLPLSPVYQPYSWTYNHLQFSHSRRRTSRPKDHSNPFLPPILAVGSSWNLPPSPQGSESQTPFHFNQSLLHAL